MKLESLKEEKFHELATEEMDAICGGRKFFGWEATHSDVTLTSMDVIAPNGEHVHNVAATGEYGNYYAFWISVSQGFRQTDEVND